MISENGHRTDARQGLRIVLVVCLVIYLATCRSRGFNLATISHTSCWIAICSLTGYWVGFGKYAWRVPIAILVATLTALVSEGFSYRMTFLYFLFSFGIVLVVAATSYAERIVFGELKQIDKRCNDHVDAFQFGVRDILLWTTSVAVALTVGKWLVSIPGNSGLYQTLVVFGLIGTMVSTSTVAIWAFLGQTVSFVRILVYGLVVTLSALLNNLLVSMDGFWLVTTPVSQLPVISAIYFLRRQDYRFVKVAAE